MQPGPRGQADAAIAEVRLLRAHAPIAVRDPGAKRRPPECSCTPQLPADYDGCVCGGGICLRCSVDTCQCIWLNDTPHTPTVAATGNPAYTPDDPNAPDGVIVGEYTGTLQAAYHAVGVSMLTVDWRPTERPSGLHYRGDAREVVFCRRWRLLIAHPWCRDVARSGAASRPRKEANGLVWRGLRDILFWLCAPADAVIVEQPIGLFERYYRAPDQSFQPWFYGDGQQKTGRLFTSDNVPTILPTHIVPGRDTSGHRRRIADPVERERLRSITPAGWASACAAQVHPYRLAPRRETPIFAIEVHKLAANYLADGKALPPHHDSGSSGPIGYAALVEHHGDADAARIVNMADQAHPPEASTPTERRTVKFSDDAEVREYIIHEPAPPSPARPSRLPEVDIVATPPPGGSTICIPVIVSDGAPRALIGASGAHVIGCTPGTKHSRDDAVAWCQQWGATAGIPTRATMLAGEMGAAAFDDPHRIRLVTIILNHNMEAALHDRTHLRWQPAAEGAATAAGRFAHAAMQRVLMLQEPSGAPPTELITGATPELAPRTRAPPPTDAGAPSVSERAAAARAACAELRKALRESDGSPAWTEFASLMADRIADATDGQIPPELLHERFDFHRDDVGLADRPFQHKQARVTTPPQDAPRAQADPGWRPHWLGDILLERGIRALHSGFNALRDWTRDMVAGKDVAHQRPSGVALGRDCFHERAWGTIWDLRGGPGNVVPLLTDAPLFETHLDLDAVDAIFANSPDREIFSMLRGGGAGVDFRDDLPHQVVVLPSLLSIFEGIDAVADELAALSKRGWYGVFEHIPMIPFRAAPRGSVPRADGGPPRGIVDQGAPRKPFYTRFGKEAVTPLNEAAVAADWGREPKPSTREAAHNHSVLLALADLGQQPLFLVALDFKYMFHQFFFRASSAWKMGALIPTRNAKGDITLSWALEYVMSMGAHPSSRIAQRFANELMAKWLEVFDAGEANHPDHEQPALAAAMQRRAALPHDHYGTHARLADAMMYTDDPLAGVVGVQRCVRFLKELHGLVGPDGMRLMLAGAHKMHLGTMVKWLGVMYASPIGCIWVPPAKIAKASASIATVLNGTCTLSAYRQLFGFLVSLLFMAGGDDTLMHFLEEPLRASGASGTGPDTIVEVTDLHAATLRRWQRLLLNMPGSCILAAVERRAPLQGDVVWRIASDAAREPQDGRDAKADGMGGALYGRWWRLALTDELRSMPIPVLEFLACCISLITFEPDTHAAARVCSEVDALATVQSLATGAHATSMRIVLDMIQAEPAYADRVMRGTLSTTHVYGPGNLMADAASRGNEDIIHELCGALGIEDERVPIGRRAERWLELTLTKLRPLYADGGSAPSRKRGRGSTEPGRSNPSMAPEPFAHKGGLVYWAAEWTDEWTYEGLIEADEAESFYEQLLADHEAAEAALHAEWCDATHGPTDEAELAYERAMAECDAAEAAMYTMWYNETHCPHDIDDPRQRDVESSDDGISVADWGPRPESCSSDEWWYGDLIQADEQAQQLQRAIDDYDAAEELLHREWLEHTHGRDSAATPAQRVAQVQAALQAALDYLGDSDEEAEGSAPPSTVTWDSSDTGAHSEESDDEHDPPDDPPPLDDGEPAGPTMTRTRGGGEAATQAGDDDESPARFTVLPRGTHGHEATPAPRGSALARAVRSASPNPLFASPPSASQRHEAAADATGYTGIARREYDADDDDSPARPPTAVPGPTATAHSNALGKRSHSADAPTGSGIGGPALREGAPVSHLSEVQQARADSLFASLRADTGPNRIACDDERMAEMCEKAIAALDEDDGELKGNAKSDWKAWCGYCTWAGVLPWRSDASAALGTDIEARKRETVIWINALLYIYPRMKNAKGRLTPPKPSSALAILRSVRRMHRKLELPVIPLNPVVRAVNKLLIQYRDEHGAEALMPHRKEPLTSVQVHALIAHEAPGAGESDAMTPLTFRALWAFLAQTGFRKAEIALDSGVRFNGKKHFSWDNVKWRIGGTIYNRLTPALAAAIGDGDMCIVRPPPSKADPFGLRWGPNPIYLPYSSYTPINAARELAALESASGIGSADRQAVPVFCGWQARTGGHSGMLRKAAVDARFKAGMEAIAPDSSHTYSVHSFRIYLCTALAAAGASDTRIQAMLRWASEDALLLYKRGDEHEYASWVHVAGQTSFTTIRSQNLPGHTAPLPDAGAARDGARAAGIRIDCDDMAALAIRDADILLAEAAAEDNGHADAR